MAVRRGTKVSLAALVVSVGIAGAAGAAAPASLAGSWRGAVSGGPPGAEVALSLQSSGDRLSVVVTLPSAAARTIELMPGDAPGILVPARGGMFSMWRGNERPDPLGGAPLVWARVAEDSLTLYRLQIARDGSYTLERFAATRTTEGVALTVSTRRTGQPPEEITAELRAAS